jgi:hypothetical protein
MCQVALPVVAEASGGVTVDRCDVVHPQTVKTTIDQVRRHWAAAVPPWGYASRSPDG